MFDFFFALKLSLLTKEVTKEELISKFNLSEDYLDKIIAEKKNPTGVLADAILSYIGSKGKKDENQ